MALDDFSGVHTVTSQPPTTFSPLTVHAWQPSTVFSPLTAHTSQPPTTFSPLTIRVTQSTAFTFRIIVKRETDSTVLRAFAKAAPPRGVDGLVWPTGVQRFGGPVSADP